MLSHRPEWKPGNIDVQFTQHILVGKEINEAYLFQTTLIVQQIIPPYYNKIKALFKFENPVFRVSNCML